MVVVERNDDDDGVSSSLQPTEITAALNGIIPLLAHSRSREAQSLI